MAGIDPISIAMDIGGKLIDRLWPDPQQAAAAKLELVKLQQSGELAQIAVNQAEAQSTNWFVAGWRPFVGWICGLALAYVGIIDPIGRYIAMVAFNYKGQFPVIDTSITLQVLFGMLGLGALRTTEKVKGAEGNR